MKQVLFLSFIFPLLLIGNSLKVSVSHTSSAIDGEFQIGTTPISVRGGGVHHRNNSLFKGNSTFEYVGISTTGGMVGFPTLRLSLMVDLVHSSHRTAIPFGIGFSYLYPYGWLPIFIRGYLEYANSNLTYGKANRFFRGEVDLGIQPISNGEIFIGYRSISWNSNWDSVYLLGLGFIF